MPLEEKGPIDFAVDSEGNAVNLVEQRVVRNLAHAQERAKRRTGTQGEQVYLGHLRTLLSEWSREDLQSLVTQSRNTVTGMTSEERDILHKILKNK